jgi:hypothetical protein
VELKVTLSMDEAMDAVIEHTLDQLPPGLEADRELCQFKHYNNEVVLVLKPKQESPANRIQETTPVYPPSVPDSTSADNDFPL